MTPEQPTIPRLSAESSTVSAETLAPTVDGVEVQPELGRVITEYQSLQARVGEQEQFLIDILSRPIAQEAQAIENDSPLEPLLGADISVEQLQLRLVDLRQRLGSLQAKAKSAREELEQKGQLSRQLQDSSREKTQQHLSASRWQKLVRPIRHRQAGKAAEDLSAQASQMTAQHISLGERERKLVDQEAEVQKQHDNVLYQLVMRAAQETLTSNTELFATLADSSFVGDVHRALIERLAQPVIDERVELYEFDPKVKVLLRQFVEEALRVDARRYSYQSQNADLTTYNDLTRQLDGWGYSEMEAGREAARAAGAQYTKGDTVSTLMAIGNWLTAAKLRKLENEVATKTDQGMVKNLESGLQYALRGRGVRDEEIAAKQWPIIIEELQTRGLLSDQDRNLLEEYLAQSLHNETYGHITNPRYSQNSARFVGIVGNVAAIPYLLSDLKSGSLGDGSGSYFFALKSIIDGAEPMDLARLRQTLPLHEQALLDTLMDPSAFIYTFEARSAAHYMSELDVVKREELFALARKRPDFNEKGFTSLYLMHGDIDKLVGMLQLLARDEGMNVEQFVQNYLDSLLTQVRLESIANDVSVMAYATGLEPREIYAMLEDQLVPGFGTFEQASTQLSRLSELAGIPEADLYARYEETLLSSIRLGNAGEAIGHLSSVLNIPTSEIYEKVKDNLAISLYGMTMSERINSIRALSEKVNLPMSQLATDFGQNLLTGSSPSDPERYLADISLLAEAAGVSTAEAALWCRAQWLWPDSTFVNYITSTDQELYGQFVDGIAEHLLDIDQTGRQKLEQSVSSPKLRRSRYDRAALLHELAWLGSQPEGSLVAEKLLAAYQGSKDDPQRLRKCLQFVHQLDGLTADMDEALAGPTLAETLKALKSELGLAAGRQLGFEGDELSEIADKIDTLVETGVMEIVSALAKKYTAHPRSQAALQAAIRHHLAGDFESWRYTEQPLTSILSDEQLSAWQSDTESVAIAEAASRSEMHNMVLALKQVGQDMRLHLELSLPHIVISQDRLLELQQEVAGLTQRLEQTPSAADAAQRAELVALVDVISGVLELENLYEGSFSKTQITDIVEKLRPGLSRINAEQALLDIEQVSKILAARQVREVKAVDTDDLVDLLNSGIQPQETCQSWRAGGFNDCLAATVIDGNKRLINVVDEHNAIVGRSIIKLVTMGEDNQPAILLERIYAPNMSETIMTAIYKVVANKASSMGAALIMPEPSKLEAFHAVITDNDMYMGPIEDVVINVPTNQMGYEYSDSLGGRINTASSFRRQLSIARTMVKAGT